MAAVGAGKRLLTRSFSSFSSDPLRVCVVGSGPAGFYTAEKVLKNHGTAQVDIIDRLPTPFGLVRSGVAPDHPETKIVMNQFTRVAKHERCLFLGNITLGSSVTLPELRELYHVVVLAYGAESDRALLIPGQHLSGIHSAREFVWWYNGHPDYHNLDPDLTNSDTAVVIGQGNVALDVARILLRPPSELAKTDITQHALAALEKSSVRKVYLVGRRGPAQAACTAKELREILGIKNLHININEADLLKSRSDEEELKSSRIHRRIYELLSKAAAENTSHPVADQHELHFTFFRNPERFLESHDRPGHVSGINLEKTRLEGESGKQTAIGTGEFEELKCEMVLKSIGYKSVPVDFLSFDHRRGLVPHLEGRVLCKISENSAMVEEGLYVCGWLKRGPTGIIGTNLQCAEETVSSISKDLQEGLVETSPRKPGRDGLLQLLDDRNVRVIHFSGWERIDAEERRLGSLRNKPREKLASWDELLRAASV